MDSKHAIVLVVEDSRSDVLLLRRAFIDSQIDAEIIAACDGDESLAIVDGRFGEETGNQLDLIILDISMPGLNGIETLKLLRERPHLKEVPILMLSESRLIDDVQVALDLGATSFANKVASVAELNGLVQNIAGHWLPHSIKRPRSKPIAA